MKKVFGLDIGTRSIVGTVGYRDGGKFHVLAQRFLEHETRAMLDGQIHDIAAVGEGVIKIKKMLEEDLKEPLTDVCIAAAGRVLRTVTTNVEMRFDGEKDVDQDDVYELSMMGVQKAYEEFHTGAQSAVRFYCVGYTVMRYYINGYQMNNPENHKARTLGADMIATFLPDDVVDGLYKAVEMAGLRVANLTLEPIAAIQVAIPERFRLLNMALVDVGAGTSDICITKDGTITAYGMIPVAGDSLTDRIAQHCLVEFEAAERIKRAIGTGESITYEDIMGISHTQAAEELMELVRPAVDEMTKLVADGIRELNGDKSVSAVFVVGGGGMIPGYTESLAAQLELPLERVAIRGKEVMQSIVFDLKDARQDSMMVTPIGICYSYYEQNNNFIFVEFNGVRMKLYDNGKLTVADAAIQAQFPNENLFPKRGDSLTYTVNERAGMTRGSLGEPSVIMVNGEHADLNARLRNGDKVDVISSTKGDAAVQEIGKLPEMRGTIKIRVNNKEINLPKAAEVNGVAQSLYYRVKNGDVITVRNWYTVQDIASYLDVTLGGEILVNDAPAKYDTKVYDSFSVTWGARAFARRTEAKAKEDAARKETAKKEVTKKEAVKKETVKKETVKKETGKKETAKSEAAQKELSQEETVKKEAVKKEAAAGRTKQAQTPQTAKANAAGGGSAAAPAKMLSYSTSAPSATPTFRSAPRPTPPADSSAGAGGSGTGASGSGFGSLGSGLAGGGLAGLNIPAYTGSGAGASGSRLGALGSGTGTGGSGLGSLGSGLAGLNIPAYMGGGTGASGSRQGAPSSTSMPSSAHVQPSAQSSAPSNSLGTASGASSGSGASVSVIVNGRTVTMQGKKTYVFVDIFDYIHFDLNRPAGKGIVTKLNGRRAEFLEELHGGEVIDVYWE